MAYTREQYLEAAKKAEAAGDVGSAEELRAKAAEIEAPTQRTRAAAQGLTFGFADEIAAALQNPASFIGSMTGGSDAGKAYEASLQQERDVLKQYREDYPYSSLAWEMGGAALPALATLGGAAPASAARAASVLGTAGRAALGGAKSGAAYGFGTGEGGVTERLAGAGIGAGFGGVVGGALGAAGGAAKKYLAGKFTDWIRNKTGDRMAGVVAAEVQRLAEQGGLTADEVIAGVAAGRLMAENQTLKTMIRKFYSEGGPAGAEIQRVMGARPGETRGEAMAAMQGELSQPGNPLMRRAANEEATRAAEEIAYTKAFAPSGVELPAPDEIVASMADIARRAPAALKSAAEVARVQYGIRPFFEEAADGTITFTRQPTLREAELTYRSLRDMKGAAYTSGQGTLGGAYGDLAESFKGELGVASDALTAARTQAATIRNANDAYKAGAQAVTKSPDELAMIVKGIEDLGDDTVMQAFREGLTVAIRASMAKPSAAPAMLRNLANEATGPGTALRMALPAGTAEDVLAKVKTAEGAQAASNYVLGGSSTAPTTLAPSVGASVNIAQEVAQGMGGDLMAWARLIGGIADRMKPKLTDQQRLEIARIVLSKDPALVEKALKDSSMAARLQSSVAQAIDAVTKTSTRAAAPQAERGLNLTITGDQ